MWFCASTAVDTDAVSCRTKRTETRAKSTQVALVPGWVPPAAAAAVVVAADAETDVTTTEVTVAVAVPSSSTPLLVSVAEESRLRLRYSGLRFGMTGGKRGSRSRKANVSDERRRSFDPLKPLKVTRAFSEAQDVFALAKSERRVVAFRGMENCGA